MRRKEAGRRFGYLAALSLAAVLLAAMLCAILMLAIGVDPWLVYLRLIEGVLFNPYGVGQVFFKASPLILTGLSVSLAFRAGLFNIGGEGQMLVGGFACAWVGFTLADWPATVLVPLCLMAAMVGGAAWATLPALMKVRRGAHEVITTIMMNFIAAALTNYLVTAHYHDPETVHTPAIASAAFLPRLAHWIDGFHGSPANVTFLIALLAAALVGWLLWRTRFGFEARAAGINPEAARTARIDVDGQVTRAFILAGALSGLASANFVMGYKHYFEEGFTGGAGFMGIAVALLGQSHPAGVVLAALLFGALSHGTLVINALVPKDVVLVLQALVILLVIVANPLAERLANRRAAQGD